MFNSEYNKPLLVKWSLGNNRFVSVSEFRDREKVDLRQWEMPGPNCELVCGQKGVQLDVDEWRELVKMLPDIKRHKELRTGYIGNLGNNKFAIVDPGNPNVDVRKYWRPNGFGTDLVRTKAGLRMRPYEFTLLLSNIDAVNAEVEKRLTKRFPPPPVVPEPEPQSPPLAKRLRKRKPKAATTKTKLITHMDNIRKGKCHPYVI